MTQTIAVDFDGVLHRYSQGWRDGSIYDVPMEGALDGVRQLQEQYAVFVLTSREPEDVALKLIEWGLPAVSDRSPWPNFWEARDLILVTNRKLPALAYLDDRAVRFVDWESVPRHLENLELT